MYISNFVNNFQRKLGQRFPVIETTTNGVCEGKTWCKCCGHFIVSIVIVLPIQSCRAERRIYVITEQLMFSIGFYIGRLYVIINCFTYYILHKA